MIGRIRRLGEVGRSDDGSLSRAAGTDADRAGRDQLVEWLREAGLTVEIDAIGNIFGTWGGASHGGGAAPVMIGSHLDTVLDAGVLDGAYGVLAALEVVEALRDAGVRPTRPVTVAAFTNEEGVRFTPDMMGSLVHAGGLPVEEALAASAPDGVTLGCELERIGYAGPMAPGTIRPHAFIELHIEQGPVLEAEEAQVGVVEGVQGISWKRIVIEGQANHAGTTPMHLRRDAGVAAARIIAFLDDLARRSGGHTVATVGILEIEPGAINIIPARAVLTADLRDPDDARLSEAEDALARQIAQTQAELGVAVTTERLVRFAPVRFDEGLVDLLAEVARERGFSSHRMTSGAGHDAQMMARITPSAMIFVPSSGGVSHSPKEHTLDDDLVAGAEVMLGAVGRLLAEEGQGIGNRE